MMVLNETIPAVRSDVPVKPPSKVRVTFYESQKPHYVSSPDTPDDLDIPIMASSPSPVQDNKTYARSDSVESGHDNPFRPDGDLSKEADEIVGLIKEGKPIIGTPNRSLTGTPNSELLPSQNSPSSVEIDGILLLKSNGNATVAASPSSPSSFKKNGGGGGNNGDVIKASTNAATVLNASPSKTSPGSGANGTTVGAKVGGTGSSPESVEVQHGIVVPPSDASQVEHVTLKKSKPKCKCCEIM